MKLHFLFYVLWTCPCQSQEVLEIQLFSMCRLIIFMSNSLEMHLVEVEEIKFHIFYVYQGHIVGDFW